MEQMKTTRAGSAVGQACPSGDGIGSTAMKIRLTGKNSVNFLLCLGSLVALLVAGPAAAQVALEEIAFVSLPGARFEIELGFDGTPPAPEVFVIDNPARLTMDFPNVTSRLEERRYALD